MHDLVCANSKPKCRLPMIRPVHCTVEPLTISSEGKYGADIMVLCSLETYTSMYPDSRFSKKAIPSLGTTRYNVWNLF